MFHKTKTTMTNSCDFTTVFCYRNATVFLENVHYPFHKHPMNHAVVKNELNFTTHFTLAIYRRKNIKRLRLDWKHWTSNIES